MRRDFDVIRKILLDVEKSDDLDGVYAPKIDGVDESVVKYHLLLLRDAGLINGLEVTTMGTEFNLRSINMTWEGHDFLDSARDETVWNKTQSIIKESVGSVGMEMMKDILMKVSSKFIDVI